MVALLHLKTSLRRASAIHTPNSLEIDLQMDQVNFHRHVSFHFLFGSFSAPTLKMDRLNMSLDDLVKSSRPTDTKKSGAKRGDKKKVVKSGGARSVQQVDGVLCGTIACERCDIVLRSKTKTCRHMTWIRECWVCNTSSCARCVLHVP